MQKIMENKGITLVALVVTIIIMLILAGVTLNIAISDNGIFSKAKKATKEYQIASEREIIESAYIEMQMSDYGGENKSNIGKKLYDRNVENGSRWDLVIEKETGITYGTGCTFIPKGTILNDESKTKHNWIIDKDGNIKELADDSFTELNFSSTVGVTDGLIFNMDATNLEDGQKNWGNNISLRYYDNKIYDTIEKRKNALDEQKNTYISVSQNDAGYDRKKSEDAVQYIDKEKIAFKFNGNNYIEIYDENGFNFSKGFTFEFYGNIENGTYSTWNNGLYVCPLLSLWDGVYEHNIACRFSFDTIKTDYFWFTLKPGMDTDSGWTDPKNKENQIFAIHDFLKNDIYLTLNFEPNGDNRTIQRLYLNGKLLSQTDISKECYEQFVENTRTTNYIEFGRGDVRQSRRYFLELCYFFMLCIKNI